MNPLENLRHQGSYLLTALEKSPRHDAAYQATIHFSGYASLLSTITDLMKLCTIALNSEAPEISKFVEGRMDIANIIELALQLMPRKEGEFMDEARELFEANTNSISDIPEFNYSSVVVLETAV